MTEGGTVIPPRDSVFPFGSRTKLDGAVHVGWRDLTTQEFLPLSRLADTTLGDKVPVFVTEDPGWKLAGEC